MKRFGVVLATVAGAGYFPVAPGTVGSAVGVVIYLLTRSWPAPAQLALIAVVITLGIWASRVAAEQFNRKDPSYVVVDEVAGQLVTLALTGVGLPGAVLGFFLFRLFDIVKPWPARGLEALPGGVGIMADDLMAGVYAWLVLQGVVYFVPWSW